MFAALGLILAGLAAGAGLGRLLEGRSGLVGRVRSALQRTALLAVNPVAFVGALWVLPDLDPRLAFLPLVGLGTLAAAFGLGWVAARLLGLDRVRTVLVATGTSYTNIGNLGGLAVFQTLGEPGYALVPIYKLFEELWYYGVLFPLTGRVAGAGEAPEPGLRRALRRVLTDPFVLVVLGALTLGFVLRASGLPRPEFWGPLNQVLVPTSTLLLLLASGMGLRFSWSSADLRAAGALTGVKLFLLPLVSLGLSALFGFGATPTVWKAALILSCMPMAFLSLVPPSLYGLDGRLTATAWGLTMLTLVVTLPLLGLLAGG